MIVTAMNDPGRNHRQTVKIAKFGTGHRPWETVSLPRSGRWLRRLDLKRVTSRRRHRDGGDPCRDDAGAQAFCSARRTPAAIFVP